VDAEQPARTRLPLLDDDGQITDPLLVIDLDGPSAPEHGISSDRVLVGIAHGPLDGERAEFAAELDTILVARGTNPGRQFVEVDDPAAEAARLSAAARANPQAALVLAGVLRTTGQLTVPAALDVESLAYSTLLAGAGFRRWLELRGPRPLPPPAPREPVLATREGSLLRLTLDRPERRNAYGRELRDALVEMLRLAERDDTIERVRIDGAGPSFCSGGDLDEFGTTPDLATAHFVRTRGGAALPLHRLAARTEVVVHGSCVGAGIELPAFAGRLVAHADTTFRLPEVAMGLIPGAGGTVSIPRRIGRWRTLSVALSGQPVDASTALAWGLVDAVR
jgi:hypothetical protein